MELIFIVAFILFWIIAATGSVYVGARLVKAEGASLWRSFLTVICCALFILLVAGILIGLFRTNPLLWLILASAASVAVVKPVMKTTWGRAVVVWLFAGVGLVLGLLFWWVMQYFGVVGGSA